MVQNQLDLFFFQLFILKSRMHVDHLEKFSPYVSLKVNNETNTNLENSYVYSDFFNHCVG